VTPLRIGKRVGFGSRIGFRFALRLTLALGLIIAFCIPLTPVKWGEPEPELVFLTIEDIQKQTVLPENTTAYLHKQFGMALMLGNTAIPSLHVGISSRSISYYVDVQIVYDFAAGLWLSTHTYDAFNLCYETSNGLNLGFRQYWPDMAFYCPALPGSYLIFDPEGPGSHDPGTILATWAGMVIFLIGVPSFLPVGLATGSASTCW